ncbi:MAG: malto-oligosyltrehalose synthase [Chloroflexota bacterium]
MTGLRIPVATCRLQFNRDFTFRDAVALVPYLQRLGITDIYASPIFKARRGSQHGYDVTDPTRLNPELGTAGDFEALAGELRRRGMGLLLDIVPNHLAASDENPWWRDLVQKGADSPFARFFDTDWLRFGGRGGEMAGYRRFFDIGELVGVRVEDEEVLEKTHSLAFRLLDEGKVTGLRIDHIDGLYDPLEYLQRLQRRLSPRVGEGKGGGFYIVVEKILSGDEAIPESWPVSGTTGYEFAARLNAFFVEGEGIKAIGRTYAGLIDSHQDFGALAYGKQAQVMRQLFPEETKALGNYLAHLAREGGASSISPNDAAEALVAVTAGLPVYRTYTRDLEVNPTDRKYVEKAFGEAVKHHAAPGAALDFLKKVLRLDFSRNAAPDYKQDCLEFVRRWQQLTGAVMAKGFEDTALYNYHRLVSLNEVGGDPSSNGISMEDFHRWNLARMERWPHTLNATSTHDTKRSEDVRARISVLSEIPGEWERHLKKWMSQNRSKKRTGKGQPVPEPNTEVLLYQTLLGAWPLLPEEVSDFKGRLKAYLIKATREAKAINSWLDINKDYEDGLLGFIDAILDDPGDNEFLGDFLEFQGKIAYYGALNSLSQVLLKIASPGVPDFYRGTELWDFSLVDPDNRRPVDSTRRRELLDGLIREESRGKPALVDDLLAAWRDGRIKLYLTYTALKARRDFAEVFREGDYLPLYAGGERREQVCAFARRYRGKWVLAAAPRFFTKPGDVNTRPVGEKAWGKEALLLPDDSPRTYHNVLTGEAVEVGPREKVITLGELFRRLPWALLVSR